MKGPAEIFIALVAAEHLYILWLEMFAWTTKGRKTFKSFPPDLFEKTKPMAANQGLYNGFLAAGLIWSLFISDPLWHRNTACFFLSCVIVAGIYGAFTVQKTIFFIQALPAILALLLLLVA
jgi:putative membrane protein